MHIYAGFVSMTKQLGVSRSRDCQDLHNVIDIIVIIKAQHNIIVPVKYA